MAHKEKSNNSNMRVKKGWLAVRVGLVDGEEECGGGEFQRFVIPISYLYHPQFKSLLESAREVYGFHTSGPLKLPCSADDFVHLLWLIEREPHLPCRRGGGSSSFRKHSFSFGRCQANTALHSC